MVGLRGLFFFNFFFGVRVRVRVMVGLRGLFF